ncbi:MAG: RNA 2',3'-cyclic phosphodiesterase [Holophagales bacterium]|nr:RNA 2',3'-cyclic phosphodiesterase [Holophagales bacterium]
MIRAFVAVPVEDPVVKRRLAGARSLVPPLPGLRWIPESQLHFTLKFLGEIEEERVAAAKAATSAAIVAIAAARAVTESPVPAAPFRLGLEGLGAFPSRGSARVLWAGCGDGADALSALASAVEEAFTAAGFRREERPFSPHLTLARVKDPDTGRRLARALETVPPEPFGVVSVSSLVLFRSELTSRGADHSELLRVAIESSAAPQ